MMMLLFTHYIYVFNCILQYQECEQYSEERHFSSIPLNEIPEATAKLPPVFEDSTAPINSYLGCDFYFGTDCCFILL